MNNKKEVSKNKSRLLTSTKDKDVKSRESIASHATSVKGGIGWNPSTKVNKKPVYVDTDE
jgi:hypothetical protein